MHLQLFVLINDSAMKHTFRIYHFKRKYKILEKKQRYSFSKVEFFLLLLVRENCVFYVYSTKIQESVNSLPFLVL